MSISVLEVEAEREPPSLGWRRRLGTTSALYVLAALSITFLPVLLIAALIWDMARKTGFSACRTALFFTFFLAFEAFGLVVLFWHWLRRLAGLDDAAFEVANRNMQRCWNKGFFAGVTKLFSVDVDVQGLSALDARRPAIVLSRHASTLDPLIPMAISESKKRFRYVVKSELLLDPALDYCGQRLCNAFVNRGSDNPGKEIAKVIELGRNLSDDDAVVIYPEGTRFTPAKRRRLVQKYADNSEMSAIVESFQATLPPLREGAMHLLESTETADVVFISHRGLQGAGSMADLISGGLTNANFEVRIWRVPAEDVPREPQGLRQFLLHHWQLVDRFAAA